MVVSSPWGDQRTTALLEPQRCKTKGKEASPDSVSTQPTPAGGPLCHCHYSFVALIISKREKVQTSTDHFSTTASYCHCHCHTHVCVCFCVSGVHGDTSVVVFIATNGTLFLLFLFLIVIKGS